MTVDAWEVRLEELLRTAATVPRAELIEAVAALAFSVPEADAEAWLDARPPGPPPLAALYLQHLLDNEGGEARRLLNSPGQPGCRFLDVASERARIGYERVSSMFTHVDFSRCRRLVMVGCGPLPVTALHVAERAGVPECLVVDRVAESVQTCEALVQRFGWSAIRPMLADGSQLDYDGAQVVFVANVVQPKAATLQRILQTAARDVQIVLREPWSLGRLWSERGEPAPGGELECVGRGVASRHLSRDVILRRRRS